MLLELKPMSIIFAGAIIVVIGGIIGAIGTLLHNKSSSAKTDRIENNVKEGISIGRNTNEEILLLKNQNEEYSKSNKELYDQNISMLSKIDKYQEQIEIKNKKIEDLEKQSKALSRGNASTIQFDGSYLDKSGGGISLISGTAENKAYKLLQKALKENNWIELLRLSETQIKESEAIKLLEYVEKETPGDATYLLRLSSVYNEIGNKKKAEELMSLIPKEQLYKFNKKP